MSGMRMKDLAYLERTKNPSNLCCPGKGRLKEEEGMIIRLLDTFDNKRGISLMSLENLLGWYPEAEIPDDVDKSSYESILRGHLAVIKDIIDNDLDSKYMRPAVCIREF